MVTTVEDLAEAKTCKEIRLELGDASDPSALAAELRKNLSHFTDVNSLVLAGSGDEFDERFWYDSKTADLLDAIGALSGISNLELQDLDNTMMGYNPVKFPATLLTKLLNRLGPNLESLAFNLVIFEGTTEEILGLLREFEKLGCLRCCQVNFVGLVGDSIQEGFLLSKIIATISKLPMIHWFEFTFCHSNNDIIEHFTSSSRPFSSLISLSNIQTLALGNLNGTEELIKEIGQSLATNTSLRQIDLNIRPEGENTSAAIESLRHLTDALRVNKTLEELKLRLDIESERAKFETFLIQLAKAVSENKESSLTKICITTRLHYGGIRSVPLQEAFVKLLEANYTLQNIEFGLTTITEIDLYQRLNCLGRKELMDNPHGVSRDKWVDALARVSNDLDALHYYLRMNPWLVVAQHNQRFINTSAVIEKKRSLPDDVVFQRGGPKKILKLNSDDEEKSTPITTSMTLREIQQAEEIQRLRKEVAELKAKLRQT